MDRQDTFKFDFVLSFSGVQRSVAQELAKALTGEGFSVFYDKENVHELLGEDGEIYLRGLYSADARYYIVLVSEQYDKSFWTKLELNAIRYRESIEQEGVLLPVIVENYKPEWLSREKIFLDLRESSIPELVEILKRKILQSNDRATDAFRPNAENYIVFISSASTCTEQYARLTTEVEAKLRKLGVNVKPSDGPRSSMIYPIVECIPEDRLIALQVKAVVDTLLRRYGPLKGEVEGDTRIQLVMGGYSGRLWINLILYVLQVIRRPGLLKGKLTLYL
jgi:hypothetical protein